MTRPPLPMWEQPWPDGGEFRFFQLGFVVDDVVDAAREWARVHGVGPFMLLPAGGQRLTYRSTTSTVRIHVAAAQAGPVQVELIQQLDDAPSLYRDWPRGRAGGLHQLCTVTKRWEAKLEQYEQLGYEVAGWSDNGGFRVAYVDTAADFGFYTEIVEGSPGFMRHLEKLASSCASWDGTDPVRIPVRGGYRTPEE